MKQGMNFDELVREVARQEQIRRDFVLDTQTIYMDDNAVVHVADNAYHPTRYAHAQLAEKLKIPKAYYDRCLQDFPALIATNVNHWLRKSTGRRMVRTVGNKAIAFLSDRYRRMDNFDLLRTAVFVLQTTENAKDFKVLSCNLNDRSFDLKLVFPRIQGEVRVGDIVQSGISISNSEVGAGSLSVQQLIYRLACKNGMIRPEQSLNKYHVGKAVESGSIEVFKDDTIQADDTALWKKVRDVITATAETIHFEEVLTVMKNAAGEIIEKPLEAITELKKKYSFTEDETANIINSLLSGGDTTRYGIVNAITDASKQCEEYERATELEVIGGEVLYKL